MKMYVRRKTGNNEQGKKKQRERGATFAMQITEQEVPVGTSAGGAVAATHQHERLTSMHHQQAETSSSGAEPVIPVRCSGSDDQRGTTQGERLALTHIIDLGCVCVCV